MAVNLNIPYFSQSDNDIEPTRTCGATCSAMCLAYFKVPDIGGMQQFEDDVKARFDHLGLDHGAPSGIRSLLERIGDQQGVVDDLTMHGSLANIDAALDAGQAVIMHGYFTRPGHIIVIKGYNDNRNYIVNDPEGEWFYAGYHRNSHSQPDTRGRDKIYSRRLISTACNAHSLHGALQAYDTWDTSQIESTATMWIHRISGDSHL